MADPFEVRMRFTSLLTHLSASSTSTHKAAHYALKHRDMDEDLHSCILENLEGRSAAAFAATSSTTNTHNASGSSNSSSNGGGTHLMNNRANIMYFLEHHVEVNSKEGGHANYIEMVRRDIGRIVEAVAMSGANVKVVRRVVGGLGDRGVLDSQVVGGIEEMLRAREESLGGGLDDAGVGEGGDDAAESGAMEGVVTASEKATPSTRKEKEAMRSKKESAERDRRAIEQRIEEDRERNKRLREGVWTVSGDDEQELEKMWEEGSGLGQDDLVIAREEGDERGQFARYHRQMFEAA